MLAWIDKHLKYIFTVPTIIFVLLMIIYPIGYTLQLSFFEWSMSNTVPKTWVGLSNYIFFFKDERFAAAFRFTVWYTAVAVFIETVLGVAIALLISKINRGATLIKTAFIFPMVATPVAVGMVWKLIYEPTIGVANYLLEKLRIPESLWLSSTGSVFGSLIMIDIWMWTPLIILIVLAGITSLPSEPHESALVDGAGWFRTLTKVTLPLLSSSILVAVLLRLIDCLKTFDIVYATTMGGPGYASENLNILAYRYAFEYFYFGKSSALLILFILLVLILSILFIFVKKRVEVEY
ncbi:carbohydrate ABC transporter permease [Paenibacillus beijingensis]|uniref:ABC transporter permease n=1 Tax=Paenibacillus beijingensis TaxID=1126833 RepID=A0A0D5NI65_9BACL|nr:sugar ABC transporter permease [Paenibacillus beijingensis]AJY75084.1 ABC transporter permease [Paenibacillus beijingensis]